MTRAGRPIGPEGRLERAQVNLSAPITAHLDTYGRGRSAGLRLAYYQLMAHDAVMEVHGTIPHKATPEENLAALQIVHDIGYDGYWNCYTPFQQFQVAAYIAEVASEFEHPDAPVYVVAGGNVYPRGAVPEALQGRISAAYIISHELINPYRTDVARHDAYLEAVRRIHAHPEAVCP